MLASRRTFFVGALAATAGAATPSHAVRAQGTKEADATPVPVDPRPTVAAPDYDPYLWLEEIEGERALAWSYSAYHLAEPGHRYPPILLATSRKDDRVHPGHARKMTAKLQVLGYEAYLYEPAAGGHSYGKNSNEAAAFIALGYTFLREKIGFRA
jgi:hypothetical protein